MRKASIFTCLFVLSCAAVANETQKSLIWGDSYQPSKWEWDFDQHTKPWKEVEAAMPAYPRADKLVGFEVSSASQNKFYVDLPSVSVGDDGVVRYTVVIRSPSGAETVSFEGMRCDIGDRKLYAFGHADGKGSGAWSRNRYAKWEPIKEREQTSYQKVLFYHYFCTVEGQGNLAFIHKILKSGGLYDRREGGFIRN
ncbi:MAG: CNP1-like family protein [Betaproteobacteria bacterium]|nr:CNP1-like family protein [Betaproteobacteria bacterium]